MSIYSRTVGAIQLFYASFFGWIALSHLMWSAEQMSWIAQNGFGFKGSVFKGEYLPALEVGNLAEGIFFALLSLSSFISGAGLLRLQSWARRWEIAYLIAISAYSMWVLADEASRGHDLGYIVLIYTVLVVPYVPFLIYSPTHRAPLGGKVTTAKPAGIDLDGI